MVGVFYGEASQARAQTSSKTPQSSATFLPIALSQTQPSKTQTLVSTATLQKRNNKMNNNKTLSL